MQNNDNDNYSEEIKTITFQPRIVKVDTGEYGVLRIRPLGAGEGLELARIHRERGDLFAKADGLKTEENLEIKNAKLQKILADVQKLSENELNLYRNCVNGEDKAKTKRFFEENNLADIVKFLEQALNG